MSFIVRGSNFKWSFKNTLLFQHRHSNCIHLFSTLQPVEFTIHEVSSFRLQVYCFSQDIRERTFRLQTVSLIMHDIVTIEAN